MKVLLVSSALTPWHGGSAISEASLTSSLSRSMEVSVLCEKDRVDYAFCRRQGVPKVLEYSPGDVVRACFSRHHWLHGAFDGVDIVHLNGHWNWPVYFFARLCVGKSIPYILQPRGMLWLGHRKIFLKRVFNLLLGNYIVRHAAAVIALSRFELAQFQPYKLPMHKTAVVPNGIFHENSSLGSEGSRSDATTTSPEPFFLYLGRIEQRKNLILLIEVFAAYRKGGGKALLKIVGPAERNHDQEIQNRIQTLGLEDVVQVLPAVFEPEKNALMRDALATVYPSVGEPYGRVPFEVLLEGGVPIIPTESGSAEFLGKYIPECCFELSKPETLLEILTKVDRGAISKKDRSVLKARQWVEEDLSWEKCSDKVKEIYANLLPHLQYRHRVGE